MYYIIILEMKKVTAQKKDFLKKLRNDYNRLINPETGSLEIIKKLEKEETKDDYLKKWYKLSRDGVDVYPSQGLLTTPYDYLEYNSLEMLPQETIIKTLHVRRFFLEMFNHPYRIRYLDSANRGKFVSPPKISIKPLENAIKEGVFLSIGDFGSSVVGSKNERVSRRERYAQGPFVKLGKQARAIFVGSSSPDVWSSAAAISTMAASHCLCALPRNGVLHDVKRQADLARETFSWLKDLEHEVLNSRRDKRKISNYWVKNVMGTLEATKEKALPRAKALYAAGVRVFRVYSPEPGTGVVDVVKSLRKIYKNEVEIFASFIVDVEQGKRAEEAGADGIFVGIGGGGRCTTGVRSGSAIDWPSLVYLLRGEVSIPVIVEGGASDHIATTLLLGASGVSVSRIASGGTIESPGGALFYSDSKGQLFKPYGGEASPRIKYLEEKLLPFEIPSFVEGETGKAYLNYGKHAYPTLTYNLHLLTEDAILSMVFRGVSDIHQLHSLDPSPLGQITSSGDFQRNTH